MTENNTNNPATNEGAKDANTPVAKPRESKENILANRIFIPLMIGLLGTVIGYFAKEYFDRERIEIVDVSIRAKKLELKVSDEFLSKVKNKLFRYTYNKEEKVNNSGILTADEIKETLLNLDKYLRETSNKIADQNQEIRAAEKMTDKEFESSYFYYSKKEFMDEMDGTLKQYNKDYKEADSLLKKLVQMVKSRLQENKNNFFIEIVVQNRGNKQGILKYKSTLKVGNTTINLNKHISTTDKHTGNSGELLSNYITIQSKTFNGLSLDIDDYFNNPGDIASIKNEFSTGQKSSTIAIYGINGDKPIASYNLPFKDDISRNENASLIELINEKFKDF